MSTVSHKLPIIDLPIGSSPRCLGVLEVQRGTAKAVLPLASVQISASVADRIASVKLTQTFRNNFSEHLEAVYIFPLSGGSVVSQFEMKIGDRVIKGLVKERQAARVQYQQALDAGKQAALLEQERDDVFTMQVGNIPPGEEVTVNLTYSERLPFFENGKTELRLPLVIGVRYIPGDASERDNVGLGTTNDTNLVPDASRITPPRLAEGLDPLTKLAIEVEIAADTTSSILSELACSQHATQTSLTGGAIKIELAQTTERLNRDFVLTWRLAEKTVKSSLIVYRHQDGSEYGMLTVMPPKRDGYVGSPRDVVFVLDRSGSMMGIKMQSAARACSLLLHSLGPADRFAIQAFDNAVEWMLPNKASSRQGMFFDVNEQNVEKGDNFLRSVFARGGTELDGAMAQALDLVKVSCAADARIPVVVLITDGQVGNEAHTLKRIQNEIGDARLFTVGVDTAVNTGLLKRLANLGGGTASFVAPGADLERALKSVAREIGEPLITDLELSGIDGLNLERSSIAPSDIPDLLAGRAITTFFKLSGKGALRIKGRLADGGCFDEKVKARGLKLPAIAQLWAKSKIVDLEDSFRLNPNDSLRLEIIRLSEQHSILTKFTAFVAVDEAQIVNQTGKLNTVVQPVEEPADWGMLRKRQSVADAFLSEAQAQSWGAPSPGANMKSLSRMQSPDRCNEISTGGAGAADMRGAPPAPTAHAAFEAGAPALNPVPQAPPPAPLNQPPAGISQPTPAPKTEGFAPEIIDRLFGSLGINAKKKSVGAKDAASAESLAILSLMKELAELLAATLERLRNGEVANSKQLASLQKRFLQQLANAECASQLPSLQKFLRVQLKELVQSLNEKGVNAAGLIPLWERHLKVFQEAQNETTSYFAGAGTSGDGRFWEHSV